VQELGGGNHGEQPAGRDQPGPGRHGYTGPDHPVDRLVDLRPEQLQMFADQPLRVGGYGPDQLQLFPGLGRYTGCHG